MKKQLRGFVVGFIIATLLMGTAIGAGLTKTIEVAFNSVNITVNGKKVNADNILYDGTTYIPLRAVAEALGKDVGWDQSTNTVSINDKVESDTVKVTRVVDGDTIIVDLNGVEERVRLIGIDTPESVHPDASRNLPEGKVAFEFTKSRLEGKEVKLEFDVQERDQYGRLLAYVYIDGAMFNKTLLSEGYARIATYPPNVKYVEDFTAIQKQAREGNKGLWSEETFNSEVVPEVKSSGTYVGSLNSDKYHKPTCRHAKNIESFNEIWFDTIQEAKASGYNPCGVCKP
jgi:micrococcal nuclease